MSVIASCSTFSATSESNHTLPAGETATNSDGVEVTVSDPQVRKISFTPDVGSSVHAYPTGKTDSLFLTVSVSSEDSDITSLRLAPLLDGTQHGSRTYRHSFNSGNSGKLSFRLPIVQAQRGAIEWRPASDERYRWQLPDSVVAQIGASPRFEVEEFAVPETFKRGNSFTARYTVTSTGERNGRFLAVVLNEGPSSVPLVSEFTIPISASQTVTHDLSGRAIEDEQSSVTAILDWGINEIQASFSISD